MVTVTFYLVVSAFLACFGSSMLYGYNLGVFNLPAKHIGNFLTDSPNEGKQKFIYSIAASIFVIGGAFGAFLSGFLADRLGRKVGMMVNNGIGIFGAIFLYITYPTSVRAFLFIGRFIVGFNNGLTMGLSSMFLTEIAPTKLRGLIGACHQLAIVFGILISNVLTFDHALGTPERWAIACGLVGVPPLIQLIFMGFMPESPRYLFIKKHQNEAAIEAKKKFDPDVPSEQFEREAQEEVDKAATLPPFKFVDIFQPKYRKAMLISCMIQVMQQASGIKAIVAYSTIMLASAQVEKEQIQYFAAGLSLLFFFGTLVGVFVIDKLGRRTLLLWPSLVTIGCLVGVCITTKVGQLYPDHKVSASIASVILIYLYIASFSLGMGPVPGLIVSELFCQGPRPAAYSISQCTLWCANFTVFVSYPNLERIIGGYIFLIYAIVDSGIWLLLFFIMPETKNRTFDEIAAALAGVPAEQNKSNAAEYQEGADGNKKPEVEMALLTSS